MKGLFTIGLIAATIAADVYFTQPNQSLANHPMYNSEQDQYNLNTSHDNHIEDFIIHGKVKKEKISEREELKRVGEGPVQAHCSSDREILSQESRSEIKWRGTRLFHSK